MIHPITHHSPSSVKRGAGEDGCPRAWWYEYRERRREPDVSWEAIEAGAPATPKQRAGALGTATHAVLETYYGGGEPDWTTRPGELALRMRTHLPLREECLDVRIEACAGESPYPDPAAPLVLPPGEVQRTAFMCAPEDADAPVRWLGYVDLEVRLPPMSPAIMRLGLDARIMARANGWVTFDYKTTKSIAQYALTPDQALEDAQGALYTLAGMRRTHTDVRLMRWVYAQKEGARVAKPVDAVFTEEHAHRRLRVFSSAARNLERITSVDQATPNLDACAAYGGCPHHYTRGGPCHAVRPTKDIFAMGFADKFNAQKAAAQAPATAPTPPPEDAPGPAGTDAPAEAPAGANAAPQTNVTNKPTRPAKAKSPAGSLAALATALAESEAAVVEATAKLEAAKAAMKAAL